MYQRSIVTFMDILGFREIIKSRTPQQVTEVLDLFKRFSGADDYKDSHEGAFPYVLTFSDSVIRVRQIDTELNKSRPQGLLYFELMDLLHAQGELIFKGILVRGGVTIGPVAVGEQRVFGPAFIDAYDLESQFARYPRIVLSPTILKTLDNDPLLRADHNCIEREHEFIYALLRQGDDAVWFIDYLSAFEKELDHPEDYYEMLVRHKTLITEATNIKGLTSLALKYNWLAHYHNATLARLPTEWFKHYGTSLREMQIHEKDLPTLCVPKPVEMASDLK